MEDNQSTFEAVITQEAEASLSGGNIFMNAQALQQLQTLMEEMQHLRQDFDTKVKYDESKERLIDTLHRELQTYREGLHFKILRPLFIDLITMYDDLGKVADDLQSKIDTLPSPQVLHNFLSFQETVEEILQRNGVEPFSVEETVFVASKQRALKPIETADPTLDKQIARRVRKGFAYDSRILRPEIVEIYKYVPR